jgi:hypothetical protein
LNPLGLFLCTSIPCIWSILSAFLHSFTPLAERTCFSQVGEVLTTCYSGARAAFDRATRRAHLKRCYLFDCACALCCAPQVGARIFALYYLSLYTGFAKVIGASIS